MITMNDRADSRTGNGVLPRVNVKHTPNTAHRRQESQAKVVWRENTSKGSDGHAEAGNVTPPIAKNCTFDEVTSEVLEEAGAAASAESSEEIAEDVDIQVSL